MRYGSPIEAARRVIAGSTSGAKGREHQAFHRNGALSGRRSLQVAVRSAVRPDTQHGYRGTSAVCQAVL